MTQYSGKVLVRMTPALHELLSREAGEKQMSLNEVCIRKLAIPVVASSNLELFGEAIQTARRIFGERVIGGIIFGSYARGELRESSDIDLLFVLAAGSKYTRKHLRQWDDANVVVQKHAVSATFISVPLGELPQNILWFEAAVDGILLFDRDQVVHETLLRIRDRIATGRIQRKSSHGQSYWVQGGNC